MGNGWLCSLLLLVVSYAAPTLGERVEAYITWDPAANEPFQVHYSQPDVFVTRTVFDNSINTTGWAFLNIQTNPGFDDMIQAYVAGFAEGSLTATLIDWHWTNTMADFCEGPGRREACQRVQKHFDKNKAWVDRMINKHASVDPYWYQVKLFYRQLYGLWAGYRSAIKNTTLSLSLNDLWWLNSQGDLEDLMEAVGGVSRTLGTGHCSALIRLVPHNKNLIVSQVTWNGYNSMLRLQKKYVLPFRTGGRSNMTIPGQAATFSSYPGVIQSGDDFYVLSSGLVTLETTIGNSNSSLWQFVKPHGQVMESIRHVVANRLATDGRTWTKTYARYNSGTYNNQWMVVDMSRFKPSGVANDTLWVAEQLPGIVRAADQTDHLRQVGYWASYNSPSDPVIFERGGWPPLVRKFGDWFSYDKTPRALIFKRDVKNVHDVPSMMQLMRSNDYEHDPLSRCNCTPPYSAENAISSRCDLNPKNGTYPFPALGHRPHGATDAKVTDIKLAPQLKFSAVSGPTTGSHLRPFKWSTSDFRNSLRHVGHPDSWTFKPIIHDWNS